MRPLIAFAIVFALMAPNPVAGAGGGLIRYPVGGPPLRDSHTYLLHGTKSGSTCRYEYPEVNLDPPLTETYVVRDLGYDPVNCLRLVEEGYQVVATPSAPTTAQFRIAASMSPDGTDSSYTTSHYHQRIWYEDPINQVLTGDTTYITWQWDGQCALGGVTDQGVEYRAQTGWALTGHGGSHSLSCTSYIGHTWATFHNSIFCAYAGVVVDHVYSDNYVVGKSNGGVALGYVVSFQETPWSGLCPDPSLHRSYGP